MLTLNLYPDALDELKTSYNWYEVQANGLGDDFVSEVDDAFNSIRTLPDVWPKYAEHYQRFILSRFPFSIIYEVEGRQVNVFAVMHNHRKPDYWKKRT